MNERIKELAEQAELELTIETKKFAELIVGECAELCSDPVVVLQHWGLDSDAE